MASAQKLPSGAWRTRATKLIDGKQIRKSFTVHPDDCDGDWRKAKALSESQANNWIFNWKNKCYSSTNPHAFFPKRSRRVPAESLAIRSMLVRDENMPIPPLILL